MHRLREILDDRGRFRATLRPVAGKIAPKHVAGLDQIRFVLAQWVVFGHCGFLPFLEVSGSGTLSRAWRLIFHNLFSGPAAVIGFFLISGFCIHFPYRHSARVALIPFFARRHIRILLPAACAIILSRAVGGSFADLDHSILWSLVCEEIYYTLYPLLLIVRSRIGLSPLIVVAFVAAYVVVATTPRLDGNYNDLGWRYTWIVGYPCWLLGAHLAESYDAFESAIPSPTRTWSLRLGVWFASSVASALRFHSPLHYRWTLDLFAVACYFWLQNEIRTAQVGPPTLLERAGRITYSLYLVHVQAAAAWTLVIDPRHNVWLWSPMMLFILLCAFVFFLIVEAPAHRLARNVQARVTLMLAGTRLSSAP